VTKAGKLPEGSTQETGLLAWESAQHWMGQWETGLNHSPGVWLLALSYVEG
jgi:hypothetical protein